MQKIESPGWPRSRPMFARCYNAEVMNPRTICAVASIVLVVPAFVVCAPAGQRSANSQDTLTVFAAASLSESFRALATAFESEHSDIEVVFNFAGSQTLSTQLEHGAQADVFASANWWEMAAVKEAGLLGSAPEYFAANRLAVAAPVDSDAVRTLTDLTQPGVTIAIAAAEVPAGAYTRESLALMADGVNFPAGFAAAVMGNVVTNETSVRGVAQKVALGEVDAGIVYETDAEAAQYAGSFRVLEIPLQFNPAAQYPIAALAGSPRLEAALAFIQFVQGDGGQSILREFGFVPPTNIACPCSLNDGSSRIVPPHSPATSLISRSSQRKQEYRSHAPATRPHVRGRQPDPFVPANHAATPV